MSRSRDERLRLALIIVPAIGLACCALVVCVIRSLAADVERAIYAVLDMLIEWARPASAIDARRAAAENTDAVHESATRQGDAQ